MEINGLPLHALVVHAAVVFGPLSALAGLVYAVPSLRDRMRWPLVVSVLIALVAIWVSALSGEEVSEANQYGQELRHLIHEHEELAEALRLIVSGYAAVSLLAVWQHQRTGAVRTVLAILVVGFAIATGVWTVLTGDAGAQVGWFGIKG